MVYAGEEELCAGKVAFSTVGKSIFKRWTILQPRGGWAIAATGRVLFFVL